MTATRDRISQQPPCHQVGICDSITPPSQDTPFWFYLNSPDSQVFGFKLPTLISGFRISGDITKPDSFYKGFVLKRSGFVTNPKTIFSGVVTHVADFQSVARARLGTTTTNQPIRQKFPLLQLTNQPSLCLF